MLTREASCAYLRLIHRFFVHPLFAARFRLPWGLAGITSFALAELPLSQST